MKRKMEDPRFQKEARKGKERNIIDNTRAEIPEYPFDAGVEQILARVSDILKKQSLAVLAFNATGDNVGKTHLSRTLANRLYRQGVFCRTFHDPEEMEIPDLHEKIVIIFDEMEWDSPKQASHSKVKELHDSDVKDAFRKHHLETNGIDLWIGLYRPDKPFYSKSPSGKEYSPIADIIIRNEEAKDKLKPAF